MSLVRRIKNAWKAALKSGKIVERRLKVNQREHEDFTVFIYDQGCGLNEGRWKTFVEEEETHRSSLASRTVDYDRFQCKGNYKQWIKVIRLISLQFTNADGSFKPEQKPGKPWKIQFVKFYNRVIHSLPRQHNICVKNWSKLELLQNQLSYVRKTIQPYFTSKQFSTSNNNNQVTIDKLVQLWCEDMKKAISIINNKGYWPESVHPEIDKKKTEEYYENKYNHFRSNLKQIVEDFPERDENIPNFTPNETRNVIKASPPGKKWGYDGVRFEDFKKNVSNTSVEVSNILNVIKILQEIPRTWKGASK